MHFLKKYALVVCLFLLIFALLIGNRLGSVFSGGSGYERPPLFVVNELIGSGTVDKAGEREALNVRAEIPRGSVIETDSQSRLMLYSGPTFLWLSENTKLEVRTLDKQSVELFLVKGRMIVANSYPPERPVTILTNETKTTVPQAVVSVVNYDFQQRISILPLMGTVLTSVHDTPSFEVSLPTDVSEVTPFPTATTTFDPLASSAKDFYQWYFDQDSVIN